MTATPLVPTPASVPAWSHRTAHLMLHLTVLVWGFTAVVGKLIDIPATSLVWYRQILVVGLLGAWFALRQQAISIPRPMAVKLLGIGLLLSAHWVTFYACVKMTTASLAALCIATVPLLTSLLEPLVFGRAVRGREIVIGAIALVAVAALVGNTPAVFGRGQWLGFGVGMASAALAGIFGTLNGHIVRNSDISPLAMTWWELTFGAAWLSLALLVFPSGFVNPEAITTRDWAWLLVLAIGCTILPWMWSLRVLKTLAPYAVALATALEPVYAMVFAYLAFPASERLGTGFYLGTLGLIALIIVHSRFERRSLQ
ncbi:MAG: DMT family transporter [Myxococcales bacterium]|nr:DMT family transporter [Myxococcales bacterium]